MKRVCAVLLILNACGGHDDYAKAPESGPQNKTLEAPRRNGSDGRVGPSVAPQAGGIREGQLWRGLRWFHVPPESLLDLRCRLADGTGVNRYEAFGTAILGGAVLGLVVHASDSWFFGQPVEPGPGHWFWKRLSQVIKTSSQGVVRGALFGGACAELLSGWNLFPINGLLGPDYSVLSAAATLGGLSSLAAAPHMRRLLGPDEVRADTTEGIQPELSPGRLRRWLRYVDIRPGLRYRLFPGLMVVGVGSGVGLLVYNSLQSADLRTGDACQIAR